MSMIRKAAATFAALALSAGLVFGSALWGAAASQVEVTYKGPFFQDIVKKVHLGIGLGLLKILGDDVRDHLRRNAEIRRDLLQTILH